MHQLSPASEACDVHQDTIFALSSGSPPAAIAIVRISGSQAFGALESLTGHVPPPRHAALVDIRDPMSRERLDRGLALAFPGPASATGEDLAELHLHGGRAVVASVLGTLARLDGLRGARPGEFTRRALENGRIDLTEAEGLADLLEAETETQRRSALRLAGGELSRRVEAWQSMLLGLSAEVEALLDFSDEDDVNPASETLGPDLAKLTDELRAALARPASERLRDGIRVTIAGPPNAGKSSLLNALAGRDAAITSAIPGTTRDVIQLPLAINGVPYLFSDTAGLRHSGDEIEAIGVDRAREAVAGADLILWLGAPEECPVPERSILVSSKSDLGTQSFHLGSDVAVSSYTGAGLSELMSLLSARATELLPPEGEIALNNRHRDAIRDCLAALEEAASSSDLVLSSEHLRMARLALHRITGAAGVENMLDVLFGRFCIGK